jgi:hypothetical protein
LADIKGTRSNKNKKKNRRRKDTAKDPSFRSENENHSKVRFCHIFLLRILILVKYVCMELSSFLWLTIPLLGISIILFWKCLFLIEYLMICFRSSILFLLHIIMPILTMP